MTDKTEWVLVPNDVTANDDPQVIVCQGPPACLLEGDAAVAAQQRGCVWCTRITVHPDGSETITGPAMA